MRTLIITLIAVTIAGALAFALAGPEPQRPGVPIILLCAGLAFGINWLAFVPAAVFKTEYFFDLTGAVTYLVMLALAAWFSAPLDLRSSVTGLCCALWAIRLGSFLFRRVRRDHGDQRFASLKQSPLRFFSAWTLQALWAFVTASAALAILTGPRVSADLWLWLGGLIWFLGFGLEVIADRQKSQFRAAPETAGRFISTGLWRYMRHPNYTGEITLWTGIALMAVPVLSGWGWLALISPLFVAILLTRISGIPLLESRAQARWGNDPAYQTYVRTTPALIPRLW